jgi:cytochrome c-type biogenesis protein CcmH
MRRLGRVLTVLALLSLAGAGLWRAADPPVASLESRAESVGASLRCPTCQGLSVADSPSQVAGSMRDIISEQLAAGRSPEEVRGWFVDRYGEWILLSPPSSGLGWLVWLAPVALVAVGAGAALVIIRRRRASPSHALTGATDVERVVARHARGQLQIPDSSAGERLESALALLHTVRADRQVGLSDAEAERLASAHLVEAVGDLRGEQSREAAGTGEAAPSTVSSRAVWHRVPKRVRWAGVVGVFLVAATTALTVSIVPRGRDGPLTGQPAQPIGQTADPADRADPAEVARLREEVRRDPGDGQSRLLLAAALLQAGRPADADAEADTLLDMDPDNLDALVLAGIAKLQQGDPAGRELLRRFLDAAPDDHPGRPVAEGLLDPVGRP